MGLPEWLAEEGGTLMPGGGLNYGVKRRNPFLSEMEYFSNHPEVAGMAAADDSVILNPMSGLNPRELESVAQNESARVRMRQMGSTPTFSLTPEQVKMFSGSEYAKPENQMNARRSILSRALSGDPSAGTLSKEQNAHLLELRKILGSWHGGD